MKSIKNPSKRERRTSSAASVSPKHIRITRNVPALHMGTIMLRAYPAGGVQRRLLGPPSSGFKFTDDERAAIEHAAPKMPRADPTHKIPSIAVQLAHLTEDFIERVKEASRAFSFKEASRELGAVADPKRGRRRAAAQLSEPVAHLLATQLLLRAGSFDLNAQTVSATIQAIRDGAYKTEQLQTAAREVLVRGAPSPNRSWVPGTTTDDPLWHLACHVLELCQHWMQREPKLSQNPNGRDGAYLGKHSEVVRLTQILQEIGVRRLWAEGYKVVDIKDRTHVYWTLVRVRAAKRNSLSGTALRPSKCRGANSADRAVDAMKRLSLQVADARNAARDWVDLGVSRRRRVRSAS